MLGKLYKYELQATGRQILPLYGISMVLGLLTGLSMRGGFSETATRNNTLMSGLLTLLLATVFVVIFVMTFMVSIRRFYNHLFKQEGYLTNTLPVKPWQLILTKSTVTMLWYFLSFVVVFLAVYLMMVSAVGFDAFKDITFARIIGEIELILRQFVGINLNLKEYFVWFFVNFLTSYMATILLIYMSLSIAQMPLFAKGRLLFAALFFILVEYIPVSFILKALTNMVNGSTFSVQAQLITNMQYKSILNVVLFIIYFIVTDYILKNHLNLES